MTEKAQAHASALCDAADVCNDGTDNCSDGFHLLDEHASLLEEMKDETYPLLSGEVQFSRTVNIVVTADFDTDVDKYRVLRENASVEFKPRKFAALMCKIWPFGPSSTFLPMKTTDLMFWNGKNVLVGATNIESARFAMQLYRQMLLRCGHKVWCKGIVLHNRVSSGHFRRRINLSKLHELRFNETTYEEKTFPGLIYRIDPKDLDIEPAGKCVDEHDKEREIKVLIFKKGPIVAMGVKTDEELMKVFERITPILEECATDEEDTGESVNMELFKTSKKLRSIIKTTLKQRPKVTSNAGDDEIDDLDEDDFEFHQNGDVVLKKDKAERLEKLAKLSEKRKTPDTSWNLSQELPVKKHKTCAEVYQDMPLLDMVKPVAPLVAAVV